MTEKQVTVILMLVWAILFTGYWGYQWTHPKGVYVEFVDVGDGDRLMIWKYGELK